MFLTNCDLLTGLLPRKLERDCYELYHLPSHLCKTSKTPFCSYNVDKKSEKVNSHLNKIREKYVKNETYSSLLSSVVTFPRATKKRPNNDSMELRRSPRKRAHRSVFDENMLEQKKSRYLMIIELHSF